MNGSIEIEVPANLDADLDMRTVNGSLTSDFPIMIQGRMNPRRMRATIGKGGRRIRLETVNGSETGIAGETDAQLVHRITIRYRSDIGPAMRLTKDARIFRIVAVRDPDGSQRFLIIHAIERNLA